MTIQAQQTLIGSSMAKATITFEPGAITSNCTHGHEPAGPYKSVLARTSPRGLASGASVDVSLSSDQPYSLRVKAGGSYKM